MYNAGAFLNSIDGLEKILNHHLGARGMGHWWTWTTVADDEVSETGDELTY
jgi:hypothetical protein